jgi:hypothetical protein
VRAVGQPYPLSRYISCITVFFLGIYCIWLNIVLTCTRADYQPQPWPPGSQRKRRQVKMPPPSMLFKNRKTGNVEEVFPRAKLQQAILKIVARGGKWSTGSLTAEIGCARSSCYGACRTLKRKHLITSEKRVAGKVFWDPVTCAVMKRSNFGWMQQKRRKAAGRMLKEVKKRLRRHTKKNLKHIDSELGRLLDPDMMPAARTDDIPGGILRRRFGLVSFDDCPRGWWLAVHLLECLGLMVLLLEKSDVVSYSGRGTWLRAKIREILALVPMPFSEVDWHFDEEWEVLEAA